MYFKTWGNNYSKFISYFLEFFKLYYETTDKSGNDLFHIYLVQGKVAEANMYINTQTKKQTWGALKRVSSQLF